MIVSTTWLGSANRVTPNSVAIASRDCVSDASAHGADVLPIPQVDGSRSL